MAMRGASMPQTLAMALPTIDLRLLITSVAMKFNVQVTGVELSTGARFDMRTFRTSEISRINSQIIKRI